MIQIRRSVLPALCACALLTVGCDDPVAPEPNIWEDGTWSPLGEGVDGRIDVVAEHSGDLVVGGHFGTAGDQPVRNIARWDGQRWHTLGTGTSHPVSAIASFQGDLIAAGGFTHAGGREVNRVARWDGERWHPMGDNTVATWGSELVSLADHLFVSRAVTITTAGDTIQGIARWDGDRWEPVRILLDDDELHDPARFTVHDGDLIVTGRTGDGEVAFARWDGTEWRRMERSAAWGGLLVAGGDELYAIDSYRIQRRTGSSWTEVTADIPMGGVRDAIVYEGSVVVTGPFFEPDGSPGPPVLRLTEHGWRDVAAEADGQITRLGAHGRFLVAAGGFTSIGGTAARGIAVLRP